MIRKAAVFLVLFSSFMCLETGYQGPPKTEMISKCVEMCRNFEGEKKEGPCLGRITEDLPPDESWVCDIAHYPREDVDYLSGNQCSDFRQGRALHFVEVDSDCNLIQTQ